MGNPAYIGPFEVLGISAVEHKTPAGGEMVMVSFASGPKKLMTRRTYDLLLSDQPRDLTSTEELLLNTICNGLFDYLKEYDVTAVQLESLLLLMSRVGKGMFDRASHIAFTKEVYGQPLTDSWVRGAPSFTDYRSLNECEMIEKQNVTPAVTGEQK